MSHWNHSPLTIEAEEAWRSQFKQKKKERTKRLISGIVSKGRPQPNKGITAFPVLAAIKRIGTPVTMPQLVPLCPQYTKEQIEGALRFLKANGHVITSEIQKVGMSGPRMTYKAL